MQHRSIMMPLKHSLPIMNIQEDQLSLHAGRYIRSGQRTPLGNIYPDWFGGITNSFTYKNLNLSFLVDFKKGGDIFSVTHMFGMYTGVLEETAATNANGKNVRDALADGGGVLIEGAVYGKVNTDGTVAFLNKDGGAQ